MHSITKCFLLCVLAAAFYVCIFHRSMQSLGIYMYIKESISNSSSVMETVQHLSVSQHVQDTDSGIYHRDTNPGVLQPLPASATQATARRDANNSVQAGKLMTLPFTRINGVTTAASSARLPPRASSRPGAPSARLSPRASSRPGGDLSGKYLTFAHYGGRLGNQLFIYCATKGLADINNMTFVYLGKADWAAINPFNLHETFKVDMSRIGDQPPYDKLEFEALGEPGEYSNKYEKAFEQIGKTTKAGRLHGYFQSWKYFRTVENQLKDELRFVESIVAKANTFYYGVTKHLGNLTVNATRVGVHIRRGDVVASSEFRKFGYTVATEEYFQRAAEYYILNYKKVLFVISSSWEDLPWGMEVWARVVRRYRTASVVYTDGREAGLDLAILARCQHMIISTGTYSWWAGWLSPGSVVYYKNWPRPGSDLAKNVNKEDYFPPSWIGMN